MNMPKPRTSGRCTVGDKIAIINYLDSFSLEDMQKAEGEVLTAWKMTREELDSYRQVVYQNRKPLVSRRL